MKQKEQYHQRDDDRFLQQVMFQGVDSPFNQVGTVIGNLDPDTGGESLFQIRNLHLDPVNDVFGVLAIAHHHDPADRLPFPVHIQHTAPDCASQLDGPQVFNVDRRTAHVGSDNDVLQIFLGLDVSPPPDQVLGVSLLDQPSPHIRIGGFNRIHDPGYFYVVGKEL